MEDNKSLIFKKIPDGLPVAGEHLVVESRPLDIKSPPPTNGITVQNLYFSLDPYQRGRMRPVDVKSYSPAYPLDEPIKNSAIAKVLHSSNARFAPDDLIINYMSGSFQEYSQIPGTELEDNPNIWKIDNPFNLDPIYFLGPLGMTGLTAYSSFYELCEPKKGETIFISAAGGAVGSLVGELAKREGLRVIGSVGDDAKLEYVTKDLGFDAAFNYKKESPMTALKRLAPDGIDIYFENVGGVHLEAALQSLNLFGRIVVCGMIADYNKPFEQKYGVKNLQVMFEKRLKMQGFIVADFQEKYFARHQESVQRWIHDGSLKVRLATTVGMDNAAEGLIDLFHGRNFGKAVLKVRE